MRAHREHTRRLREEQKRAANAAKRAAKLERMRKTQDTLIESSRIANNIAREEYEKFLEEAERGLQEIEVSKLARVERERHVSSRYMVALRQRLLEQISDKKLQVPNICSCVRPEGETAFFLLPLLLLLLLTRRLSVCSVKLTSYLAPSALPVIAHSANTFPPKQLKVHFLTLQSLSGSTAQTIVSFTSSAKR